MHQVVEAIRLLNTEKIRPVIDHLCYVKQAIAHHTAALAIRRAIVQTGGQLRREGKLVFAALTAGPWSSGQSSDIKFPMCNLGT